MAKRKPFFDRHIHLDAFVTPQVRDLINKVLAARGLTFTGWLNLAIERDAAERLPESQGGVKRIIPPEVAQVARETLEQQGDFLCQLAKKTSDPKSKKEILRRAGQYYDGAAFFGTVEGEAYRRKHILETGQKSPRHRRKAEPKPAMDSSSKT